MREMLTRTAVDLEPIYQHLHNLGYEGASDKVTDTVTDALQRNDPRTK